MRRARAGVPFVSALQGRESVRTRKECSPITDPQLCQSCVASFNQDEPYMRSSIPAAESTERVRPINRAPRSAAAAIITGLARLPPGTADPCRGRLLIQLHQEHADRN